ncbi:MAG: TldD/PmbA family protein [Thiomargarita sp.]|nr:TldD/PmbA family protein [Thiomargarita sp.]
MQDLIKQRFYKIIPKVDFCSLRYVAEHSEKLVIRQNVMEPPVTKKDIGVMITVFDQGGAGYAATSDLTESGLRRAVKQAQSWAICSRKQSIVDFSKIAMPQIQGHYQSQVEKPWQTVPITDKIELLQNESKQCKINDKIAAWQASLWSVQTEQLYLTSDGGEISQQHEYLMPEIRVTANQGIETQYRTLGEFTTGRQGGLEVLEQIKFIGKGKQLAEEALQLLAAPNCPAKKLDLLLAPDQMMLQIHESIGHPLELDRIIGDERNYAGTSFVTLDMFGNYQYGSPWLNVSFDPSMTEQLASYGFDDEGLPAKKVFVIREGILETPLGGHISQTRAGLSGVANSRANNWNRPPIDRMANLNVEAGQSSLQEMISSIEAGILMQTNISWSIDDSRNKFQFGCERGQLIENGELTTVVKNPNYRGISATFWRNLSKVGNKDTFQIMGVPYCGKGEPNQVIRVGHASPACVFSNIDVFGGAV